MLIPGGPGSEAEAEVDVEELDNIDVQASSGIAIPNFI
jgi:hypothetical protein